MDPSEPVGRVQGPRPTSLRALLPLPVLNLGAASEDLTGTKCKPFIWANVPTLQMRKLRSYEVKGVPASTILHDPELFSKHP